MTRLINFKHVYQLKHFGIKQTSIRVYKFIGMYHLYKHLSIKNKQSFNCPTSLINPIDVFI